MAKDIQQTAASLEKLASAELRYHTPETTKAMMDEINSIDPTHAREIQKALRSRGSLTDPDSPEVRIHAQQQMVPHMVEKYGREVQKIDLLLKPDGYAISGEHYNWKLSYATSPRTVSNVDGAEPQAPIERKMDIFAPSYERTLPSASDFARVLVEFELRNALRYGFE